MIKFLIGFALGCLLAFIFSDYNSKIAWNNKIKYHDSCIKYRILFEDEFIKEND